MKLSAFIFIFLIFITAQAHAVTTVYVDPFTTPHSGHAGTIGDPYQTFTEPCAALNGIGGIILMNYSGTPYIGSAGNALYTINCSGVNGNPIIWRGNFSIPTNSPNANPSAPVIENTNTSGCGTGHDCGFAGRTIQIRVNTAYVEFQNLIITGFNTNTSCIFYETTPITGQVNHDITLDHLTMSNCGCDSLYAQGGDYYTITNNTVTNSGGSCASASVSGIHIYQPINYDNAAGTHILVANNIISGESKGTGPQSDGNAIQVPDDANGTQSSWCSSINAVKPGACPYTQQISIQNNIAYNNDGDCYSYYSSSNPVLFVNNDCYQNVANQVSNSVWGEVVWNITTSNTIGTLQSYNNIVQARGAGYKCHFAEGSGASSYSVAANANDNYVCTTAFTSSGSGSFSAGAANVTGNPNFTSPTSDFTLTAPSPAIGTANGSFAPSTNIFQSPRTGSGGICTAVGNPSMGAI